ncbi:hypothetical protein BDR05DRAFT_962442 [Suillus weaverae]|nr:hypothetical protein BDR05DRAFT_962442 [Suillus weaverae]
MVLSMWDYDISRMTSQESVAIERAWELACVMSGWDMYSSKLIIHPRSSNRTQLVSIHL